MSFTAVLGLNTESEDHADGRQAPGRWPEADAASPVFSCGNEVMVLQ